MKSSNFLTFLLLIIGLYSCRQDIDNGDYLEIIPPIDEIEDYEPEVQWVFASVEGFVVDGAGQAIVDAEVHLGDWISTTDINGYFAFEADNMNALGTVVMVLKPGYFNGNRRFYPREGRRSFIEIELIELEFDMNFLASEGGLIVMNDGAQISFEAGSIVDENGVLYTGEVQVAAVFLDPQAENFYNRMLGALQGVDEGNKEVALLTYGMVGVELLGSSGQKLNIGQGFSAEISVPATLEHENVPEEMPLWAFNKKYGLWVLESQANLVGDKYVGEVSHFSFWNFDWPIGESVQMNFRLVDASGAVLPYHGFSIVVDSIGSAFGISNANGEASGLVPHGEQLTLELEGFDCDVGSYYFDIEPLITNTDLGDFTIENDLLIQTNVITSVVDCQGNLLEDAYIKIFTNGELSEVVYSDSSFINYSFHYCEWVNEISVVAGNPNTFEESEMMVFDSNSIEPLGQLIACGSTSAFTLILNINNVTYSYEQGSFELILEDTLITNIMANNDQVNPNQELVFELYFNGDQVGDYSGDGNTVVFISLEPTLHLEAISPNTGFDNFIVTEYTQSKIVGSFSGPMNLIQNFGQGTEVEVIGSFIIEQ